MPLRIEKTMFLKDIDFLQEVPSDIVSELVELVEERSYSAGSIIIAQGEIHCDISIAVVAKGRVEVLKDGVMVDAYNQREIFGHLYLGYNQSFEHTLIAKEDTLLYEIDKDLFYGMIQKNHEFARAFIEAVGQELTPASIKTK